MRCTVFRDYFFVMVALIGTLLYLFVCNYFFLWLRFLRYFINMLQFCQLIECPSIYELMGCLNFRWQHIPLLEIWREKQDSDGNSDLILESYPPAESIEIFKEALASNMVSPGLLLCQVQISEVCGNFMVDYFIFPRFNEKRNSLVIFNLQNFNSQLFSCHILKDPSS